MNDKLKSYIIKADGFFFVEDDWMDSYSKWLNDKSKRKKKRGESAWGPYNDPDDCLEYYKDLCIFLNNQEEHIMKGKLKYKECEEPFGIRAINEDGTEEFILHSDQLGFSAPKWNGNHPYDWYIDSQGYTESSINDVCKWIYYTRTIGGGFLWPKESVNGVWENNIIFNLVRGRLNFLQDRVDLTLSYIHSFYENGNTINSPIFSQNKQMYKWLSRFGRGNDGWKNYIDFMMLTPFVDERYIPISMGIDKNDFKKIREWRKRKDLLNCLCNKIIDRSNTMI